MSLGPIKIIVDESTGRLHPHPEVLKAEVLLAHRAGFQIAIHAVTLEALDAALDAIAHAQSEAPRPDPRHRIEHCSVCPPDRARRLRALGVHVCTQPGFIRYSGDRYLTQVSGEELPWLYPLRTLEDAGVPLAGSSDCPVAPADPLAGIAAAVERRAFSGALVSEGQAIPLLSALRMYTLGGACAVFQEHRRGRIAPGYAADLVAIEGGPFAAGRDAPASLKARLTIMDGKVAWPPDYMFDS